MTPSVVTAGSCVVATVVCAKRHQSYYTYDHVTVFKADAYVSNADAGQVGEQERNVSRDCMNKFLLWA